MSHITTTAPFVSEEDRDSYIDILSFAATLVRTSKLEPAEMNQSDGVNGVWGSRSSSYGTRLVWMCQDLTYPWWLVSLRQTLKASRCFSVTCSTAETAVMLTTHWECLCLYLQYVYVLLGDIEGSQVSINWLWREIETSVWCYNVICIITSIQQGLIENIKVEDLRSQPL